MRLTNLAAALLLLAAVVGCSDGNNESESAEAPQVDVTVTLEDSAPLAVLFNKDDVICSSTSLRAAFSEGESAPVEVTVRDAEGAIVATETLPDEGGTFGGDGCTWPVTFQVDESAFYEATVVAPAKEATATAELVDGVAEMTVVL